MTTTISSVCRFNRVACALCFLFASLLASRESQAQGIFHPHIVFNLNGDGSASGSWTTDDPSFIFTPSASGTATFTHGYADSDATMKLYNYSAGTLLQTESNSDGNNSMSYSVTAGTEYRLWLDMPFTRSLFSITIDLATPPVTTIALNSNGDATYTSRNISPSSEGEYWKYTAPAAGSLTVVADSVGGIGWDTDLFVFNSSGTLIYSDTGGANDGDYPTTVSQNQVLYLLVRGDVGDEGSDSTGNYDLYIAGPSVPAAPTANAATSVTSSGFTANWSSVSGATGYRLDVSTSSSFSSYVSGYQNLDVGNVTSRSVTGLNAGTTYYYRVRAYNSDNTSGNSGTISVTPVPAAPTANAASGVTSSGFTANWSSVSGATGYRLDVSTSSSFSSYLSGYQNLDVGNVTSRAVTGLNAGTTYYYRLRAYNNGGTSGNSGTISVTTVPPAPTANAATSVTSSGFTANWSSVSGATGYRLDVSTSSTFSSYVSGYQDLDVGNVTSRSVSGLSANTTYYNRVRAYNGSGTSGSSSTITVTTAPPPTGTVTVTVRNGTNAVAPTVSGAVVVHRDASWAYVTNKTTDANGQASFTVPAGTANNFEFFYTNPTFGSGGNVPPYLAGRDQPEFWGSLEGVTAGTGTTVTTNFYRWAPIIVGDSRWPWLDAVVVRRTDTGAVLPPGETVVAGTTLQFDVRIRNNWGGGILNSKARLLLDRDKTAPYDQDILALTWMPVPGNGSEMGFSLTWTPALAGNYYRVPWAKVRLPNGNEWTSDSWTWPSTPLFRVAASAPPKGITVITHGFRPSFTDWPVFMARAISRRLGGGQIGKYDTASGIFNQVTFSGDTWNTTSTSISPGSGETIVVFDWVGESDKWANGWSEAAGDALFAALTKLAGNRAALANFQWHFVGHSRGAIVNSETVERFAAYGIPVTHMTTLDAHDFAETADVPETLFRDWELGQPQGPGPDSNFAWTNRWGFTTWNNVAYSDNFFSTTGIDPDGRASGSQARNTNISVIASSIQHSEVHAWYLGTVDPITTTNFDGTGIQTNWYPGFMRIVDGWNVSRYGPPAGSRPAMNGLSKYAAQWNSLTNAVFNGRFDFSCRTVCDNSGFIPGWQLHGGSISSDTQVTVESGALALKGMNAQATHNRLYIPGNATHLLFDARVIFPSIILAVSIDGTTLGSFTLTAATSEFAPFSVPVPANLRDGVRTISFEITQAWSQSTQLEEVRIDNVRLDSLADVTPPSVAISSPPNGTTYTSAQTVTLSATASDNVGITKVEFYDGATFQGVDTASPYNYPWSISSALNGSHAWAARAFDAAGNVATSSVVNLTVNIVDAPSAPTANPASGVTSSGFTANWSSVSGATGYRLDVSTSSSFSSYVSGYQNLDVGNVTSRGVSGLNAGTTYHYRVRAYNNGGTSGNSGTISVTTVPPAPTANAATSGTSSGFTANWSSASGATGYRLDVSTSSAFSSYVSGYQDLDVGNVTSRSVSGLSASTTYYYQVRAYNGGGISGNSGIITVTTNPATQPTLGYTRQGSNMVFWWPTNFVGFTLEYTTNLPPGNWTAASPSPVSAGSNYVVTNTMSGNSRFYRLKKP